MATIKPIEARSIHQIQSGQVIVDLCSVVKELVENSLDAGATSIEVRFKGNGLEAIEVQDNGNGVAPEDYETIALKHYTSKLASYDDLTSLQTFGFRGEALSSLCALSNFHITTAQATEAPRGTRLHFEISGKLKDKSITASQKGTTVTVEGIFKSLPVRRKELEKNIKREYGKALGLLQAYACISTGVRVSVSNQPAKGNKTVAFSTKANLTTKENISNVYGAKTVLALLPLDLELQMQPSLGPGTPGAKTWSGDDYAIVKTVKIKGHISRPVVGEGRQTPDRQMFFVNARPCSLPQVSRAFNEVYKSYNVMQSAFMFVNLILDTNAYDVNVSPDKRTIMLHDQTAMLESIKTSLTEVFDSHDQSVPQALMTTKKLPVSRNFSMDKDEAHQVETVVRAASVGVDSEQVDAKLSMSFSSGTASSEPSASVHLVQDFAERNSDERTEPPLSIHNTSRPTSLIATDRVNDIQIDDGASKIPTVGFVSALDLVRESEPSSAGRPGASQVVRDFRTRMANQRTVSDEAEMSEEDASEAEMEPPISSFQTVPQRYQPGPVINAFDRMRSKRPAEDTVTVTVGAKTTQMTLGASSKKHKVHTPRFSTDRMKSDSGSQHFGEGLRAFVAPGTQLTDAADSDSEVEVEKAGAASVAEPNSASASSELRPHDSSDQGGDPTSESEDLPLFVQDDEGSDDEYVDEDEKKRREEARVARMIAEAEEAAAKPSQDNIKRAANALKGRVRKDSTLQLVHELETSVSRIEEGLSKLNTALKQCTVRHGSRNRMKDLDSAARTAEERLALTVLKSDFGLMRVAGQFNLGFILALRPATAESNHDGEELFIIDQHAADEKYNFERLSATTIVQNQRLVHAKALELTAVEEEIILEHSDVLVRNGFVIETDTSGETPVGRRCKLVSLPMSKEVTFTLSDLEELVALLGDNSTDSIAMTSEAVVRPSKVRKMLAMRACRSSIMVGRNLSNTQMTRVVAHMGAMDKPWNCPHGRPTMRHLFSMERWQDGWMEGKGVVGMSEDEAATDWKGYLKTTRS